MGRRKKTVQNNNLQIAAIFAIFVGSLVVISILLKFFLLVKQSSFDGDHRFTVLIASEAEDKKTVISFSPETQSLSLLTIKGSISSSRVGRFLETPIDGRITYQKTSVSINKKTPEETLRSLLLGYKNFETNLTIIDLLRLWHFSRTLSTAAINTEDISTILEEERIDKISYSLFSDSAIVNEKLSIQIINGTQVSGLGNRLARLVTNMGGNVIAVSTSDKDIAQSEISYMEETSYTTKRLRKVLGFPTQETQKLGLSDITIKIGKDSLKFLVF